MFWNGLGLGILLGAASTVWVFGILFLYYDKKSKSINKKEMSMH